MTDNICQSAKGIEICWLRRERRGVHDLFRFLLRRIVVRVAAFVRPIFLRHVDGALVLSARGVPESQCDGPGGGVVDEGFEIGESEGQCWPPIN